MAKAVPERGRSSVVEHNLAKVGVESSNLFARSNKFDLLVARPFARPSCRLPNSYHSEHLTVLASWRVGKSTRWTIGTLGTKAGACRSMALLRATRAGGLFDDMEHGRQVAKHTAEAEHADCDLIDIQTDDGAVSELWIRRDGARKRDAETWHVNAECPPGDQRQIVSGAAVFKAVVPSTLFRHDRGGRGLVHLTGRARLRSFWHKELDHAHPHQINPRPGGDHVAGCVRERTGCLPRRHPCWAARPPLPA